MLLRYKRGIKLNSWNVSRGSLNMPITTSGHYRLFKRGDGSEFKIRSRHSSKVFIQIM